MFLDAYREARPRALAPRAPRPPRRDRRHLRAVVLRRHVRRGRPHRGDQRRTTRARRAGQAHLGARAEARLLPRQAHGPLGRDRAGPPRPRGHARLHAGLPLLPGGLLVPPRPRARSGRRRGHDEEVHRRVGLERGRPALALDRGLLADRAAREVPGAAALRPARLDLAAVAARRGLLGRPRRRRLGGPQVRLHVRARDGLGPPAPRHQQDVHQRRHDPRGRRRLRARLGPHQGLHDDRPADRDGPPTSTSSSRSSRASSPRAGSTAARTSTSPSAPSCRSPGRPSSGRPSTASRRSSASSRT